MLNLSTLVRVAKRYAYNPSMQNERFINALLEPYVTAAKVTGRGGFDFYLDKYRTSKILAGKVDTPLALKNVRLQHGLEERVARECAVLFDETLDPSFFEFIKADLSSLVDASDSRQAQLKERLSDAQSPESLMATALIGAIGARNIRDDGACFWKKGPGSLCWKCGDLLHYGFANRKKARNLVAIPVDCTFKTHVTRDYECVTIKEVSERSVHGQWLTRMAQSGVLEDDLKERITNVLRSSGVTDYREGDSCPRGTVVAIDANRATYLLLAVTRFNERGMSEATAEEVEDSLRSLMRYYDENGQGNDLYLPLVGTGLSRSNMDKRDSFEMIRRVVTDCSSFVGGKVTIVVLPEDAEEIGLMKRG